MFAFKLWAPFGAFRDPLTITQNLTFIIPPKTTVGGIMASILGIDYNDYFKDDEYFNFQYSIILDSNKPIRKKSFAQNYTKDYTKKGENKYNAIGTLIQKNGSIQNAIDKLKYQPDIKEVERKKLGKKISNYVDNLSGKMTKPKPIYRELLINPSYLIFINNFKHEKQIIEKMKKHYSAYQLYMGNSEFPANYVFFECEQVQEAEIERIHSFTANPLKILFETDRKYTTAYFAMRAFGNRQYADYKKVVVSDKPIRLKEKVKGYRIKISIREFYCEFI